MTAVIQVKRGSASSWTSANTVLAAGEIGFETDTKKMKVGDGSTAWNSLGYTATDGDITGVTAGTGLSGGGNSGAVTVSLDTNSQYVVPSQTSHSGKYLTTNGTTSSWGTVDLSEKTDKSTLTTTGDIYYASAANTPARLGIGSTGQILKVNNGLPSWQNEGSQWSQLASGNLSGNITSLTGITKGELILIIFQAKMTGNGDGPMTLGMNNNAGYQSYIWNNYYHSGRIPITHYLGGSASSGVGSISIYIPMAQTTFIKPVILAGNSGYAATYDIFGSFTPAEAISSLQIVAAAGGTFNNGTYTLYGR